MYFVCLVCRTTVSSPKSMMRSGGYWSRRDAKRVPQEAHHAITHYSAERKFTHRVMPARKPFTIVGNLTTVELIEGFLGKLRQECRIESSRKHQQPLFRLQEALNQWIRK